MSDTAKEVKLVCGHGHEIDAAHLAASKAACAPTTTHTILSDCERWILSKALNNGTDFGVRLNNGKEEDLRTLLFEFGWDYIGELLRRSDAWRRLAETAVNVMTTPPMMFGNTDGWIDVKERMPRYGEWVWVVYQGVVQLSPANLCYQTSATGADEWEWADREADNAPVEIVTHWMPVPKFERKQANP